MASQVTLKALGLNYSPNNLSLPEGSLAVANDVIVRRDNVLESRRGFRQYNQELAGVDISKQLISYKDRILNHYSNTLQYDTGSVDDDGLAIFQNFSGSYTEVEDGLRIKSAEVIKNLYFTTSKGIKKISATSSSDFTTDAGYIKDSGAVKALDFNVTLETTQGQNTGFLPSDTAVAYRTLWGYRDANDNLILGAPSDSLSVYNYLSSALALDIEAFCSLLDTLRQNTSTYYSNIHNISTKGTLSFPTSTATFANTFGVNYNTDPYNFNTSVINIANYLDQFSLISDINNGYTIYATGSINVSKGDVYKDLNTNLLFTVYANSTTTYFQVLGTGLPAGTLIPITGTLQKQSGAGGSTSSISYTQYSSGLPYDRPMQVNVLNTYTCTVTALSANAIVGAIYRDSSYNYYTVTTLATAGATTLILTGFTAPVGTALTYMTGTGGGGSVASVTLSTFTVAYKGFSSSSGVGTIDFTADPSTTFSVGDTIEITGAVDGTGTTYTYALNKFYSFTLSAAASLPTFSTLTSNGQTFKVQPFSAPITYTFTISAGTPVVGDVYYYDDPATGYRFTYTVATFLAPTMTATGLGYLSTTPLTLTRLSGTGSTTITYSAVTQPTQTTLYTSGTGLPASSGSTGSLVISGGTTSYAFTSYLTVDPVVSSGAVYTNNSKSFSATSLSNYSLVTTGTGTPQSSGILYKTSGTGSPTFEYTSYGVNTLKFTNFNNSSATKTYWTITNVNSTTNQIQFTISSSDTISSGSPGSAIQIVGYNYRYITQTGDSIYSDALSNVVMSSPPTNLQLNIIQHTIYRLVNKLKLSLSRVLSSDLKNTYAANYAITTAANTQLKITIPTSILYNKDYFCQVYRTRNFTATYTESLINITPDDEMRLVFEGFPEDADFANGYLIYDDSYPEDLRNSNVNLYTNPVTGEGISQANDIAPIAKDINTFKNVLFFANTKTRHRLNPLQLQGTSNISASDSITISNGVLANNETYEFVVGTNQYVTLTINSFPSFTSDQVYIYSANNTKYTIYFNLDNTGSPSTSNIIVVNYLSTDSILNLRDKTIAAINSSAGLDFVASAGASNSLVITNTETGKADNASIYYQFGSELSVSTVSGTGEDVNQYYNFNLNTPSTVTAGAKYSNNGSVYLVKNSITSGSVLVTTLFSGSNSPDLNATLDKVSGSGPANLTITGYSITLPKVLLSQVSATVTAAQSIDQTARSLVKVINSQLNSSVNAYYISSSTSLPGQINLESKTIDDVPFYIQGSSSGIGTSFNPDISPIKSNSSVIISRISSSVVQFDFGTTAHNLINGNQIMVTNATVNSAISGYQYIDGIFTVQNVTTYTFQVVFNSAPFTNTTIASLKWSKLSDVSVSNNETKPNRIYYSKILQPESVPLLNYFDVGSANKQILRIFPLRDSLFVFKEDGLYRISGETSPFVVTLFDSSCVLIAPDTVSVANNIIYGWTNKGISNVTEAGVTEVSRPIDTVILKLASANYVNFPHASWGLGYDSDNSYTVYTCANTDDTVATVAFRFSNLTNTWTNFVRSQTCGVVNLKDDKIYCGSGSASVISQERKNFNRTDYSDENFKLLLNDNSYSNQIINLPSTLEVTEGDVITQTQGLTIYQYESLLEKLDIDPNIGAYNFSISADPTATLVTVNTLVYNDSLLTPKAHGLSVGDWITINNAINNPLLSGDYQIVNVPSSTSFKINVSRPITTAVTGYTNLLNRNYEKTLAVSSGVNFRTALLKLASYLTTDPGLSSTNYNNLIADVDGTITSVTIGNPGVILGSDAIANGRVVTIYGSNSTIIPSILGNFSISVSGIGLSTTFSIDESVTTGDAGPSTGLSYTTASNSNTVNDIAACFNIIVNNLNSPFSGTSFKNYELVTDTTLFEAVILSVDTLNNTVAINLPIQLVTGEVQIYKAIPCEIEYSPLTFGDPLTLKQVYESTLMFQNKAFTRCSVSFSSDLKPEFTSIEFLGQGNGEFGFYSEPGFGYGFFGGSSNAAPCRTIIPRQNQRCRYINMRFDHHVAREIWTLYGVTLTFNPTQSTRAYR